MRSLLTSACLFGCVLTAATPPALAEDITTARVHYTPADLASDDAVAALYGKVAKAAKRVCRAQTVTSEERAYAAACEQKAVAKAVADIDKPAFTAFYTDALAQQNAATKSATLASR
jgi:UrcA family protein